ncbi:MAG: PadR family transcriptional regulator [Candidatus Cloacimonetes bacterium]|nr:PadR family transcriptional regulator [Candidatus Cloacimonadota bacterium]
MEATWKFRKELNAGISSLLLLSVMDQAEEPLYGYLIAKMISEKSGNIPIMKQGALYPVLRSLAALGLLDSHVDPSVSGPPRRYYWITEAGRKALKEWRIVWTEARDFIEIILGGENV